MGKDNTGTKTGKKKTKLVLIAGIISLVVVLLLVAFIFYEVKVLPATIMENKYNEAIRCIQSAEIYKAQDLLYELGDYKDSKERLLEIATKNTKVRFGPYEWIVLDRDGNDMLLLLNTKEFDVNQDNRNDSRQPYHTAREDVTWETSYIRSWLNDDFYNTFTDVEKAMIMQTHCTNPDNPHFHSSGGNDTDDFVFLLSPQEADQYKTVGLKYGTIWWLRMPGDTQITAAVVQPLGNIDDKGLVVNEEKAVRPAIRIRFSDN